MSLIDIALNEKNNNKKQQNCKDCNKELVVNSPLLLCESCFNNNVKNVLNNIKNNLIKINDELKKVENTLEQINKEMEKELHIVILNSLEIDFLNFKAIQQKLKIDLNLNKEAFKINQIQSNKIRREMNWTLFEILEIENI